MGNFSANGSSLDIPPEVDLVKYSDIALAAAREAVQAANLYHKRMGHSIIAMEDGKIIEIPPEEIDVEDPLDKKPQSSGL